MESIAALFTHYGSDKDTTHSYGPVYDALFAPVRESVRLALELGVGGGGGLRALRDYFPGATVLGLDADPSRLFGEDRIRTYVGRQSYAAELLTLPVVGPLDVVIDDAGHAFAEQLFSWRAVAAEPRPGGLYCIEDVQNAADAARFAGMPWATVYDLRGRKGRYDDVLVVLRKRPDEAPSCWTSPTATGF